MVTVFKSEELDNDGRQCHRRRLWGLGVGLRPGAGVKSLMDLGLSLWF